jgi:hypothetical protein
MKREVELENMLDEILEFCRGTSTMEEGAIEAWDEILDRAEDLLGEEDAQ